MGYLHISNLYKDQRVLLYKQLYALEKVHGTSAHITWNGLDVTFFSGGEKQSNFEALFDKPFLQEKLQARFGSVPVTIYGEAYGGKCQGMSDTYGKELRFIVFDVREEKLWYTVPAAEALAAELGLEFVPYSQIQAEMWAVDEQRDWHSRVAARRGLGTDKLREGIVLRPLQEFQDAQGERVIAKHKRDEFKETKTARVVSPDALQVLTDAREAAREWVTAARLQHVLDKIPGVDFPRDFGKVLVAMVEDVLREGSGELVDTRDLRKEIGKHTIALIKKRLMKQEDMACGD